MKFTPLNDRLLVQRTDPEDKSSGGIIIPDSAKEKPHEGIIRAVGAGKLLKDGKRRQPVVKVGDHVLFGKYSGDEIKLDNEDYFTLREDEVLAVVG